MAQNSTIDKYVSIASRLVFLFCRQITSHSYDEFPLDASEEEKTWCLQLRHLCSSQRNSFEHIYAHARPIIHRFWWSLLNRNPATHKIFDIPLYRFFVLFSLSRDGSFKDPQHLTSPLAGLQWWCKLVVFEETVGRLSLPEHSGREQHS